MRYWVLITTVLATLCIAASTVTAQNKNETQTIWEYRILYNISEQRLNELAQNGWELVLVDRHDYGTNTYLKRPKTSSHTTNKTVEPIKCRMALAAAPAIRGLRLGMMVNELLAVFPDGSEIAKQISRQTKSADTWVMDGLTQLGGPIGQYKNKEPFAGVDNLTVRLFEGRVVELDLSYSPRLVAFDQVDEMIEVFRKQFSLPEAKDWKEVDDYAAHVSRLLSCEGFNIVLNAPERRLILSDATLPNKRKAYREKLRREFKP